LTHFVQFLHKLSLYNKNLDKRLAILDICKNLQFRHLFMD